MKKVQSFAEYMQNPPTDKWIGTLQYWKQNYHLPIPHDREDILRLKELIIQNDEIHRFPKAIIHLTNLKKLMITNSPGLTLSQVQKRWIIYLKKSGCDVTIDNDIMQRSTIKQSGKRVQCSAVVNKILETEYSFGYKVLLQEVVVKKRYFRSHVYIKYSKLWKDIKEGDAVEFKAIVKIYFDKRVKKKGLRSTRKVRKLKGDETYLRASCYESLLAKRKRIREYAKRQKEKDKMQ